MNIFYWSQLNCLPAACLPQLPASCKPFTFRYSQLTNIVFLPAGTQSSQLTRLLSIIGPAGKCRKQFPLTWHLFNKRFNMLKMSFFRDLSSNGEIFEMSMLATCTCFDQVICVVCTMLVQSQNLIILWIRLEIHPLLCYFIKWFWCPLQTQHNRLRTH